MLYAFVDESESESFYWMAALICDDATRKGIATALDQVCADASAEYGVTPTCELHGYDLLQAEGDWESMKERKRARIGVYAAALQAVGGHDVAVILRGVERNRLVKRYWRPDPPHSVVLSHLLERVDLHSIKAHGGELVHIVADQVGQQERYRRDLAHYQQHATSGYLSRKIVCVADIAFVPSHTDRLIQAVDLILYLFRRMRDRELAGLWNRADVANREIWAAVAHCVVHSHCWLP